MRRILGRLSALTVVAAAVAAVLAGVASANFSGSVAITCTDATYTLGSFPSGSQDVLLTVFVDGVVATQTTASFVGPDAPPITVQFSVPSDGQSHMIEANAYSITNQTPIWGLPGIVSLTCGAPPPPPPSVCTYTKGYYRNHPAATSAIIAGSGGKVLLGSTALNAAQAQSVLNATPGSPGNVTFSSNLLLNLAQQVIAAELNGVRGSTVSPDVQSAVDAANAGISVALAGGQIQLSSSLATMSSLEATIETFNSATDCG
jgi:hypothetical protein